MKRHLSILILVFLTSRVLASAAEPAQDTREPTPLAEETFAGLKKKFPGEVLDADLKTLHELAESSEYKNFLAEAYPDASVPPEFTEILNSEGPLVDDTLYRIRPPKKRYLTYYTEHFGVQTPDEVTDAEHFIVHHEVMGYWIYDATKRGGDTPASLRTQGPRLSGKAKAKLVGTSQFKEMMKRRLGIEIQEKPDVVTSRQMMPVYELPILRLAHARLAADARWMQSVFEKHGTSDGLLWIALRDPALLSQIRYAFTTSKTFLRFVQTPPEDAEDAERAQALQRIRKSTQPSAPIR